MKCIECGNDSNHTSAGMCPDCYAVREREVEERALTTLERIADALERLANHHALAARPAPAKERP